MLSGIALCWWSLSSVFIGDGSLCSPHKTRSVSKILKSALQEGPVFIHLKCIKMNILRTSVVIFLVLISYFVAVRAVSGRGEGWGAVSRGQCHGRQGRIWQSGSTRSPDHQMSLWWWGRFEVKLGSQSTGQDQVWWGLLGSDAAQQAGPSGWEQSEAKLRSRSTGQVSRSVDPWPGSGMAWSVLETSIPAR